MECQDMLGQGILLSRRHRVEWIAREALRDLDVSLTLLSSLLLETCSLWWKFFSHHSLETKLIFLLTSRILAWVSNQSIVRNKWELNEDIKVVILNYFSYFLWETPLSNAQEPSPPSLTDVQSMKPDISVLRPVMMLRFSGEPPGSPEWNSRS